MKRAIWLLTAAGAAAAVCACAARAASPLEVGAVVPELLDRHLVPGTVAALTAAGLNDAARVTLTWQRGQSNLNPNLLDDFRYGIDTVEAAGADVYLTLYPNGSSETPLTATDQATFANWAAWLIKRLPEVEHVIVGNEPNLNRFWAPQFGPGGKDAAAAAYVRLLARTYDALKAASPSVEVVGGALSHAGINRPGSGRDTHSPGRFLLDMGKAYRDSGRTRPIMDALAFHPYLEHSDLPPTYKHYSPRIMTIADYGRLVSVLRRAFDGTHQPGSDLPIVYAEFGVESRIPPSLVSLYSGIEPSTTHPVSESTQAKYYALAMHMAACQPTVRTFLVFRLIDSPNRPDWQSGLYYVNGTPKSSRGAVAAAARRARAPTATGCAALLAPKPLVSFFPARPPTRRFPTVLPLSLLCDADCAYQVRVVDSSGRLFTGIRGTTVAGTRKHVSLPPVILTRGTYRISIRVTATDYRANAFVASRIFSF